MDATILIVEDDRELAWLVREELQKEGFQVLLASDGIDGMQLLQKHCPDLILMDVMMPRMDGWEACRCIRQDSDVPIIMLTARQDEQDRVRGLQLGADDYVIKPFSTAELVARIQAVLRRCEHPAGMEQTIEVDNRLVVDLTRQQVFVDGQAVDLSSTEYKLLTCLLEQAGCILTHQSLLTQVWGWEYADETNYLKVYIYRLRNKIEIDPSNPRYILTERCLGYRFHPPIQPWPV
ncbi:MAG: response regulator transcription factor [Anaerolineae bacterium]|jgi:two-component system KDP operon response regulator KdpE